MVGSTPRSWESRQTQRVLYYSAHETWARVDSFALGAARHSHRNPTLLLNIAHILVSPHRILLFESCREIRSMRGYKSNSKQTEHAVLHILAWKCVSSGTLLRNFTSCLHVLQPVLDFGVPRRVFCETVLPSSFEPEPSSTISSGSEISRQVLLFEVQLVMPTEKP